MKKGLFLISILLNAMIGMAQIPTDGLVGFWSFNDNLDDSSGYGNNGTTNGCIFTTDRFEKLNSCVEFDGIDDVITIPHSESIDFDSYTDNYTISFWFKTSDPIISEATSARFIEKWDGNNAIKYPHNIVIVEDSIKTIIYDGKPTSRTNVYGYFTDEWHNFTLVNNIETDTVSIYMDGVLKDAVVNSSDTSSNNQTDLLFGNTKNLIRPYAGLMDDIRIYNRVLNQGEIDEIVEEDNEEESSLTNTPLNNKIDIYPNPSSGIITIGGDNIQNVEVLDINGKVVLQTNSLNQSNLSIDISNQSKGIYFIRVITSKGTEIRKIVFE